jgi:hypothetical protein
VTIVVLTPAEHAATIEHAAENGVERALRAHAEVPPPCGWMGYGEVTPILGTEQSSVREARGLPPHVIGNARRYGREDVEAFITSSASTPVADGRQAGGVAR